MRLPLVALALLAAGCTSSAYAPLNDPHALVATDGIILLDDEHGETLPITPDSVVTFDVGEGWTDPVRAGLLCRSAIDFSVRVGDTCDGAIRLAPYDEIRGVHVETADRAGTIGLVSVASGVALAAVAAIALVSSPFGKSKSSGSRSSSSSSSSRSGARSGAGTGAGTGSGSGSSGLTLKNPPPHNHAMSGHHVYRGSAVPDAVGAVANVALNVAAAGLLPPPGSTDSSVSSVSSEGFGSSEDQDPPSVPIEGPCFTPREVRRADVSVLASVDGTASLFNRNGLSTGAHVGIRVDDFVDIGIGGRWLDGGNSLSGDRVVPTGVIGLHGELPRARWAAIGLSFEGGHGNDIDIYLAAKLGVRFEPVRGLWIGVYPLHPSYIQWADGRGSIWVPQSSADLSFGF